MIDVKKEYAEKTAEKLGLTEKTTFCLGADISYEPCRRRYDTGIKKRGKAVWDIL